jgi:hypothetical protein
VPNVSQFDEQFMTYSKTNNRPSTVYAKEWMMRLHLIPFFGAMKLDAIGPADIEKPQNEKPRQVNDLPGRTWSGKRDLNSAVTEL